MYIGIYITSLSINTAGIDVHIKSNLIRNAAVKELIMINISKININNLYIESFAAFFVFNKGTSVNFYLLSNL